MLVSKVNVSSEFVCISHVENKTIIWEKFPNGLIIYSINPPYPASQDRFVMNVRANFTPINILRLLDPKLTDAGIYTCMREGTQVILKLLTHVVVGMLVYNNIIIIY